MASHPLNLSSTLTTLSARAAGLWRLDACGVTRTEAAIPALVHTDAYAATTSRRRVLLVGGLSGHLDDVRLALHALDVYLDAASSAVVALSAVPVGNPDGLTQGVAPGNGVGGQPATGYPPVAHFYDDTRTPEARYLWRWVGLQAPDIVIELRAGSATAWEVSSAAMAMASALRATPLTPADSLLAALGSGTPNGLAPIPGVRLTTTREALATELDRFWTLLTQHPTLSPSPARRVLDDRRRRPPLDVARLLAGVYGYTLDPVVYTQGMAISGRLRLAQVDSTSPNPAADIANLVEPLITDVLSRLGPDAAASALGGLVWAPELAEATGDHRYADLFIQVAERYRPGVDGGAPPPSDPAFRTEDMAMNGMLLGRAYQLTGRDRYLELLTSFLLQARIQQDNGLFWHCRTAPYYWGRGNGFAALGFCETLSYLPDDHRDRHALLAMHQRHLDALLQGQHASGMFSQVLDMPGSYQEFTATCMVGYCLARGLRRDWLGASYRAALDLAWQGVVERIDAAGGVVDACTNTGVQTSLRAYLDRPAIFGRDDRSGSMALWFALEMAQLSSAR